MDGRKPLQFAELGTYAEISRRPNPEGLKIVFIPTLVQQLLEAEQLKQAPLTHAEFATVRDRARVIATDEERAETLEENAGFQDLDPAGTYEDWLRFVEDHRSLADDLLARAAEDRARERARAADPALQARVRSPDAVTLAQTGEAERFDVLLTGYPPGSIVQAVAAVRRPSGLSLADANYLVNHVPAVIMWSLPDEEARRCARELEAAHCVVEVVASAGARRVE